jgi:hypothetical protein
LGIGIRRFGFRQGAKIRLQADSPMPQADSLFLPLLEFFSNKSGDSNKPDISSVESFSLTVFSIGLSSRKPNADSRMLFIAFVGVFSNKSGLSKFYP